MAEKRPGFTSRMWERRNTVRVRTTLGAVAVVGLTLLVGAIAMVFLLDNSLTQDVERTARFRAASVVELVDRGGLSTPIAVQDEEDQFVQVLDEDGTVLTSSENLAGRPAVASIQGEETEVIELTLEDEDDEDDGNEPFLAVAAEAGTGSHLTVIAGQTLESVEESVDAVVGLLATGGPLLLLILAGVMWGVVGRALAPVELIRREVEAISTEQLHRRVPDPNSGDEISRLAETMNRMLGRLERGQKRQRRFVSDASHELRSPVATIRQHAEVAVAHPDSVSSSELAGVVLDENLRLQRLVEDLLLLATTDESDDYRGATVDLDDIVFAEVSRLRDMLHLSIETKAVSAGRVSGEAKRLARLVGNLLDNATRHARRAIVVSLSEVGDEVVLRVDDDGDGVPESERARVFERFERLQEARDRDTGGTGLGLAIVAEVAAAHGGTVTAGDAPLGGARFEVRFPRFE